MSVDQFDAFIRLRSTTGVWIAPPELRTRLVEEASAKETSLNDLAITILAIRFGVSYETSGRRSAPDANAEILKLRIPVALARRIGQSANARLPRRSMQDEIREQLCAHYGLTMPPAPPRGRRAASR